MKKIGLALLLVLLTQIGHTHPWKPSHYVIIDTDAGIDDMRAISMLIASHDVKILGIIVSGGALSPYDGYKKVKSMLNFYHHEGIPVAMNYNIRGRDMEVPLSLEWGEEDSLRVPETNGFNKLCKNILQYETASISFVALGSLNSVSELLSSEVLPVERIKEIVWSNNNLKRVSGFNAEIDSRSANRIIKGGLPLVTVGYPSPGKFYDQALLDELSHTGSRYASHIINIIKSNPGLEQHSFALNAADEMTVIYLHNPELFRSEEVGNNIFMTPSDIEKIKSSFVKILNGGNTKGHQTMKEIPTDTSFYQPDLQPFIADIITNHGIKEWESCIITNELHRHLGIYSIIGAKMGILAREYFNVGVDEMEVTSFAGSTPPLSCMNDGLQASTGATTGHGLLEVKSTDLLPAAIFIHNGASIRISLKTELAETLNNELRELNIVNGLDSDIYWELVRQRAILYWKNLDKYEIFDITVME